MDSDSSDSSICGTCTSALATKSDYCLHCGSKRVDGGAADTPQSCAPVPIGVFPRRQSASPSAGIMMKLFSKSQECSTKDLLSVRATPSPKATSARRILLPHRKVPSVSTTDVMAAVTALQEEVRSLREDLREETKARFKGKR